MQENVVAVSLVNEAAAISRETFAILDGMVVDLLQMASTPNVIGLALGMDDAAITTQYLEGQLMLISRGKPGLVLAWGILAS